MKFLARLLGSLFVFALGIIVGFVISPVKHGMGTVVNYNYKKAEELVENNGKEKQE
ncbi:MAG: hypothetical protein RSC76_09325 [Oscillospiraceae bacterium]